LNGVHHDFTQVLQSMKRHFQAFDALSEPFWNDVDGDPFRLFGATVTAQHVDIGAMLCGMTVKLACWRTCFPRKIGTPRGRLVFSWEITLGLGKNRALKKTLEAKAMMQ
jgi:hypothetical protein